MIAWRNGEFDVRRSERDLLFAAVSDTTVCLGDTVVFDLSALDANNDYLWQTADNRDARGPVLVATIPGDYLLTTRLNGCGTVRDTIRVSHVAPEDYRPEFDLPDYGFVNTPITFRDASAPAADSVAYTFPDDDAIIDLGGSPLARTLSFDRVGTYPIGMEAFAGACYGQMARSIQIIQPTTNLDSDAELTTEVFQGLVLYPNPHDGDFNVKGTAMRDVTASFRCYDDLGRLRYEAAYDIKAGVFDVDIDAAAMLSSGMQSIVIEVDEEEVILRHYRADR